jgi:hypothetical protein
MVSLNKEQNIDASCINNKNESSSVIGDSEGNININNNNNNNESHGENDSASNSTPPSVTSAVGSRLSDYFEKMTEMQRRAFEKLYETASNGPCHSLPCHSSNSSEGPCHALVVCEQSLEQNFKEMVRKNMFSKVMDLEIFIVVQRIAYYQTFIFPNANYDS